MEIYHLISHRVLCACSGMEAYIIDRCLGVARSRLVWCAQGLRGLVKPTTMVMLCPTGVNPIGPNWGENALVTKYSGTLEL